MLQSGVARDVGVAASGAGASHSDALRMAIAVTVLAIVLALAYVTSPQCASPDMIRMGTALTLPGC